MDDQRRAATVGGVPVLILVAVALAGFFGMKRPETLESERGASAAPASDLQVSHRWYRARLWEDPLETAQAHFQRNRDAIIRGVTDTSPADDPDKRRYTGGLDEAPGLERADNVVVMPVLIQGTGYAEDREDRIRSRYAIVSALNVAGYTPVNSEVLSFMIWVPPPYVDPNSELEELLNRAGVVVPFEWFRNRSEDSFVLVQWLDELAITNPVRDPETQLWQESPLSLLHDYVKDVTLAVDYVLANLHNPDHNRTNTDSDQSRQQAPPDPTQRAAEDIVLDLRILGPTSSGTLASMIQEIETLSSGSSGDSGADHESAAASKADGTGLDFKVGRYASAQMYSAWCTADAAELAPNLIDEDDQSKLRAGEIEEAEYLTKYEGHIGKLFAQSNLEFGRIGSDRVLASALVDELCLRGGDPRDESGKNHVVLIAEWDTLYGRSLSQAFKDVCGKAESKIHQVTYLRGLDGRTENRRESEKNPESSDKSKSTGNGNRQDATNSLDWLDEGGTPESASGTSQIDYLRRLGAEIENLDAELRSTKDQIVAIGVVGSDTFDKLLVLKALRAKFTNCIFFTTDLDAAFLTRRAYESTRNVVVAAHFGLQLNQDLYQKGIPPFRSSYQTSLYFAALRSLGHHFREADSGVLTFEIGRNGPYLLSPQSTTSIHYIHRAQGPRLLRSDLLKYTAILLGILLMIPLAGNSSLRIVVSEKLRNLFPEYTDATKDKITEDAGSDARRFIYGYGGFLFSALAIAALALFDSTTNTGEPLSLLQGISIWPTAFLRLGIIFLAIYFVRKMRMALEITFHEWFPDGLTETPDRKWPERFKYLLAGWYLDWTGGARWYRGPDTTVKQLQELYYSKEKQFERRIRVIPLLAIYILLYVSVLGLGGEHYYRPFRGPISGTVDLIVQLGLTIASIFLVVRTLDVTLVCCSFIRSIDRNIKMGDATESGDNDNLSAVNRVALTATLTETVGRFIYYSFTVTVLSILARNSFFDAYNWPLGVIVLLVALFATNAFSLYLLQRSAFALRRNASALLSGLVLNSYQTANKDRAAYFEAATRQIDRISIGAFRPFTENPLVRALLIPLGGVGGMATLQALLGL